MTIRKSGLCRLILILAPALLACSGGPEPRLERAADLVELREFDRKREPKGKDLFIEYCSFCHGREASGQGLNAQNLPVPPANLRTLPLDAPWAREYAFNVIKEGGAAYGLSEAMPPFGRTLSDEKIRFLVSWYLRGLQADEDKPEQQ